jgi:branched-chain amino acid transport system substrate-binding protein
VRRSPLLASVLVALLLAACGSDAGSGDAGDAGDAGDTNEPIVVGGTLSLTGAFAPTAAIHEVTGELFVEQLNADGGLLGRPVEWRLLDDESSPDRAGSLYERLISEDEVDALIGPYGTGNVNAAMTVAERNGYVLPQHTGSLTYTYTYPCQFPAWGTGRYPNETVPELLFDALDQLDTPPQTIAFLTDQFPSTLFVSKGEPGGDATGAVAYAEEQGLEVVLDVEYPTTTSDWGPIAAQVREADPDFIFMSAVGAAPASLLQALQQLDYQPRGMFTLWGAPGPLLALGPAAEGVLATTFFEAGMPPVGEDEEVATLVEEFAAAAESAGLAYPVLETQAAASWTAWEILAEGIRGAESLDQEEVCDYLRENGAETTFLGQLDFGSEENNYYGSREKIKQVQGGSWKVVWPEENQMAPIVP